MSLTNSRYNHQFSGVITAIVTPFLNGYLDMNALEVLLLRQISAGVHGIVPCGTTGEGHSLNDEEYKMVIEACVKICDSRLKIIAASGFNNTLQTLRRSDMARVAGAHALLIVAPYYNKPPQDGLKDHFLTVARQNDLPIIIYNIPSRTGVDISDDTIAQLFCEPKIQAIKDSSNNLERVASLRLAITKMRNTTLTTREEADFLMLSGEDSTMTAFNCSGGGGVISVLSNIFPKACVEIYNFCKNNDYEAAQMIQHKLFNIIKLLFSESNPIPVKFALAHLGLITNELRLPLRPLDKKWADALTTELDNLKQYD